ncbi:FERM and PDZ domain-containing protein 4 [Trichonephila clavata]|uniref:FERM and PDZ domain-containing protein 4 n=1 Tax=Trichonephila clavata TaxID=2740835 RepID=A0A8X6J395_TRICU|nr:FERM and PDZ domain-containing protein 4 [Trichonephila clavata]
MDCLCIHHRLWMEMFLSYQMCSSNEGFALSKKVIKISMNCSVLEIAAKPGAHHLFCVLRVTYVPKGAYDLLQKDPIAFEYLYLQCCNDVVVERFTSELKYDIALHLTALNIQQHCFSNRIQGKVTVKMVERECGLERFVPIISELPSYDSKCFATNISDSNPETTLLVSPRYGVSQISCLRNTNPVTLCLIEGISSVKMKREDEYSCIVELVTKDVGKKVSTSFFWQILS